MRAKVFGVKSNMAASSSQMFCFNCGAEAVPKANFCTRCGQGNMFQAYFEYLTMEELMNNRYIKRVFYLCFRGFASTSSAQSGIVEDVKGNNLYEGHTCLPKDAYGRHDGRFVIMNRYIAT